jgi:hypothetical protein
MHACIHFSISWNVYLGEHIQESVITGHAVRIWAHWHRLDWIKLAQDKVNWWSPDYKNRMETSRSAERLSVSQRLYSIRLCSLLLLDFAHFAHCPFRRRSSKLSETLRPVRRDGCTVLALTCNARVQIPGVVDKPAAYTHIAIYFHYHPNKHLNSYREASLFVMYLPTLRGIPC